MMYGFGGYVMIGRPEGMRMRVKPCIIDNNFINSMCIYVICDKRIQMLKVENKHI